MEEGRRESVDGEVPVDRPLPLPLGDLADGGTPERHRVSWTPRGTNGESQESPRGTPERDSPGNSGTSTPRKLFSFDDIAGAKKKIRHLSGKTKMDNVPPLNPLTIESFGLYREYIRQNNFSVGDISKTLVFLPPNSTLEDCSDQRSVLHAACEDDHGFPALVEALLLAGHSTIQRTSKGYTALHLAIYKNNNAIVKKLLAAKDDGVNSKTNLGHTPIHIAVMSQNHDAITMLRRRPGSDFGVTDNQGETAIHLATKMYRRAKEASKQDPSDDVIDTIERIESMIKYLLDSMSAEEIRASLRPDKSNNPVSSLHIFAELDCFSFLVTICNKFEAQQDEFELKNQEGLTPFMICIGRMYMDDTLNEDNIMQMLDESIKRNKKGKRAFNRQESTPDSPLGCAKLLLEKMFGETLNDPHPEVHHMTALQIVLKNVESKFVSSEAERDLVALLLDKGANVHATHRPSAGEAPIYLVNSSNYDKQMSFLFLKHLTQETINQQDDQGETVLHYAVSKADEEAIELILKKGANIMIRNNSKDIEDIEYTTPNAETKGQVRHRTPLMVALKNDSCKLEEFSKSKLSYPKLSGKLYLDALTKVGVEKVVDNVETKDLMKFLQTHISAAAFTKNNQVKSPKNSMLYIPLQVLRVLCQYLSRGSCFQRIINQFCLTEKDILYEVVHYLDATHFEKTFHKTALAWTNENDDPISASDLLHFEYQTHETKREGLNCMKNQLTNDKLLYWMTRTFSKFYPTPNYILWTTASIVSCLQLGLSYFFYLFDIVSDLQLTRDYKDALDDIDGYTHEMWKCARHDEYDELLKPGTCFLKADKYPRTTYETAYYLTIFSMVISIAVYIIGIIFFFDSKNITEKLTWFKDTKGKGSWRRIILKYLLLCGIRIFWPFFHIYRRIRYEASRNKSSRRKNLIEFESIWIMVKTIEYGIEATVQLIIVLYLLVPFYDQIHDWDFQTTCQKTFNGIAHFMTGGWYSACLLEKVVGKLFINVVVQSLSLTTLRYIKYGMSIFEHASNMWPLFLSNISQIVARIMVLRVFFVTAEDVLGIDSKGLAITLFFLIHFTLTFCIKITFELNSKDYCRINWICFYGIVKFLINLISSSIVYTWSPQGYGRDPRRNVHEHNTFLPQLLFQSLILMEHLILIILPLSLSSSFCLDSHTFQLTAFLVPCLWLVSILCLSFHYKNFHTWSQTNGPSQTCWGSTSTTHKEVSCVSGFCCSHNLFKVTLDRNCLNIENMNHTDDFKLQSLPHENGFELKFDVVNSQPLLT